MELITQLAISAMPGLQLRRRQWQLVDLPHPRLPVIPPKKHQPALSFLAMRFAAQPLLAELKHHGYAGATAAFSGARSTSCALSRFSHAAAPAWGFSTTLMQPSSLLRKIL